MCRTSFILAALLGALLLPVAGQASCGTSHVCRDVLDSLAGQVIIETVTITWSTPSENGDVDYYKVKRYDCATPETCSVEVGSFSSTGSCNLPELYQIQDSPPDPESWTYTLELWKADGRRACSVDVKPASQ